LGLKRTAPRIPSVGIDASNAQTVLAAHAAAARLVRFNAATPKPVSSIAIATTINTRRVIVLSRHIRRLEIQASWANRMAQRHLAKT
jgi:hypothetical protein